MKKNVKILLSLILVLVLFFSWFAAILPLLLGATVTSTLISNNNVNPKITPIETNSINTATFMHTSTQELTKNS